MMRLPISSSKAMQIAMEDSATSYFINTSFSKPEQNPKIYSHKWISEDDQGCKWNVEIIEKSRFSLKGDEQMLKIVLVEIDATSGRITRRKYLRNILDWEYKKYLKAK